jgi:hypothetical protein
MSAFTSNFAPQIEAMLDWRTSLGHTLRDMRNAMAGFRPVLLIASPQRDGADPGTGDRVVPGHGDGHLGRLPEPRGA